MAHQMLAEILLKLRRRMLWIEGASGLGWGLALGLICLILGVWMDLVLEFSPTLRIGTLILSLTAFCVLGMTVLLQAAFQSNPRMIAARLDHIADARGQICSGLELSMRNGSHSYSTNPDMTQALAEMAVSRAADLAVHANHSQAVPTDPLKRSFITFFSLLVLPLLFALLLPQLAATEWNRFANPSGDHPPFSHINFQVEPEGAKVIFGEGIDIYVTLKGTSAEDLELVLEPFNRHVTYDDQSKMIPIDVLPMFPEGGNRWRVTISDIRTPLTYYVRSHSARSRRYNIEVITVPNIVDARFRVTAPEYTGLPEYEGPLPQGGLSGLPGTQVKVTLFSNRPLSGGKLKYLTKDKQQKVDLIASAKASEEANGEFTIREPGQIVLTVTDVDGQESKDAVTVPVIVLVDERPFVRLLQPKSLSLATPSARVPVVISAEDDFGLSRIQLFRSLNHSRFLPLEVPVSMPPPTHAHEVVFLPLSKYGLAAGDEIRLFARVEDNDPNTGNRDGSNPSQIIGKGSESSVVVIRIISQEEYDSMERRRNGLQMFMSKYQQARRRMESLAEEMETLQKKIDKLPADSRLKEETLQELRKLSKLLEKEADTLKKLADQQLPYQLDNELSPQLKKQAEALKKLSEQLQTLTKNKDATNELTSKRLKEMLKSLNDQREHLDSEMMAPLDTLSKIMPLMQDQSRFVQIYQRQRDLANRLESLKGEPDTDDPILKARMRDLESEQNLLQKELIQLLSDIEEHIEMVPAEPRFEELRDSALKFVKAVRKSGATEAMTEAAQGLAEFSGTRGHAGALKAADILQKFLSQCNGMAQAGQNICKGFQPALGECLSKTISQLLAETGFRPGSGTGTGAGTGAGGGFSAQRSTMQNVGLYGDSPFIEHAAAHSGSSSDDSQNATGRSNGESLLHQEDQSSFDSSGKFKASGSGESLVPLKYRRKVGRYFQRIADEVGDQ
ncbi:hypothetical protein [Gimesia algae]|uniref:Uncharacterized protein n=1 Tax=Gimesia algae TaxID=2527971 RepID=A0A517VKX1_9PLAN|nr:hypothetical protein [Gimesia algae]QDT93656.1 hypothetical protein Pan161_53380 [Gimesia algae]